MIQAVEGPLISWPQSWLVCFDTVAPTRFLNWIPFGHYKHVRAFGYVPFLHVWVFYDPHWRAIEIIVAADGEPAKLLIGQWIKHAEVVRMPWRHGGQRTGWPPLLGWCVPCIKRLIGLQSGALRPDALWRHCLANGGEPFEDRNGLIIISADAAVSAAAA